MVPLSTQNLLKQIENEIILIICSKTLLILNTGSVMLVVIRDKIYIIRIMGPSVYTVIELPCDKTNKVALINFAPVETWICLDIHLV